MKIESIDKNFVPATVGDTTFAFADVTQPPFVLEGFSWVDPDHPFCRIPPALTKEEVNEGALYLGRNHTAGGAIRFRTDSGQIAIRATLANSGDMNHMPRAGSAGFDIYRGTGRNALHFGTAQPNAGEINLLRILAKDSKPAWAEWTVNFPLYGGAQRVEIGILPGSHIEAPTPHAIGKPVLFYGSSITQGGCASRPGNNYASMLCRAVDAAQINLGFSGSARGEPAMANAIASLDLACFVLDYDHNAPTVAHLQATHEPFFKIVRAAHPDLPIILLSRSDIWFEVDDEGLENNLARREIIMQTYLNARASGDKQVYFIDGAGLFGVHDRSACTVDRCHPNDLGFYRMFEQVLPTLRAALGN